MDIQRIRNITTGKLHTKMEDIYEDVETLIGETGIMTHMLPRARDAMLPWLQGKLLPRFWDNVYDPTHTGDFPLEPMNEEEKKAFWQRYSEMPSPLAGKQVVVVEI